MGREKRSAEEGESGENPAEALIAHNRSQGTHPDPWTAGARWKREADVPDEVYFRTLEALGEATG